MTALAGAVVVFLAAILKGAISFGFPTVATPVLALFIDVKTAVAVLVVPNIVMDGIQARRRGSLGATARRLAVLLVFGGIGTVLGTRLLIALSSRTATMVLGAVVLTFVVLNATRFSPRVPADWERWLSPPVGLLAGVIGGITNVPGTPLVIYFYALGMDKTEFVRSVAFSFVVYKVVQLGALVGFGAFTVGLVPATLGLTAAGLAGFFLGLRIQDRLDQGTFNRVVLVCLGALGGWLILRAASW